MLSFFIKLIFSMKDFFYVELLSFFNLLYGIIFRVEKYFRYMLF